MPTTSSVRCQAGQRALISLSTAWIAAIRSARRAATTARSSGGEGGFGIGVFSRAGGGDATDDEEGAGLVRGGGVTGRGLATAGVAAGGGTVDFALFRLRRTTMEFGMGVCERSDMLALFLESTGNAILCGGFSE